MNVLFRTVCGGVLSTCAHRNLRSRIFLCLTALLTFAQASAAQSFSYRGFEVFPPLSAVQVDSGTGTMTISALDQQAGPVIFDTGLGGTQGVFLDLDLATMDGVTITMTAKGQVLGMSETLGTITLTPSSTSHHFVDMQFGPSAGVMGIDATAGGDPYFTKQFGPNETLAPFMINNFQGPDNIATLEISADPPAIQWSTVQPAYLCHPFEPTYVTKSTLRVTPTGVFTLPARVETIEVSVAGVSGDTVEVTNAGLVNNDGYRFHVTSDTTARFVGDAFGGGVTLEPLTPGGGITGQFELEVPLPGAGFGQPNTGSGLSLDTGGVSPQFSERSGVSFGGRGSRLSETNFENPLNSNDITFNQTFGSGLDPGTATVKLFSGGTLVELKELPTASDLGTISGGGVGTLFKVTLPECSLANQATTLIRHDYPFPGTRTVTLAGGAPTNADRMMIEVRLPVADQEFSGAGFDLDDAPAFSVGNIAPVECVLVADYNQDGLVIALDLLLFLADLGSAAPSADLNIDGRSDFIDLRFLLNGF